MPLPTTKQRIWQALRLKPSTLNDLALVVDAPRETIYSHLRQWQSANLLSIAKIHERKQGPAPLQYSLIDRSIVDPPISSRSRRGKSERIWAALERKSSTIKELIDDEFKRPNVRKILQEWVDAGLVAATQIHGNGQGKPPVLYSIIRTDR